MFFEKAYYGRNSWWRWVLTIAGAIFVMLLAQIPLIGFIALEAERLGVSQQAFFSANLPEGANRNLFLLLILLPFAASFGVLWLLINWLHRKSLRAVMTGRDHFDWRRVVFGFAFWFALLAITMFSVLPSDAYRYQFNPETFIPLLAIALILIPFQTTLEEVFFRGYLMQGIGLLARNKLTPLIAITLFFALIHYSNPEFANSQGFGMLEYLLMSLMLGMITVMDDGLELACGIHASNNIFLATIMSASDGTLKTDAIFETDLQTLGEHFMMLSVVPYVVAFAILFWVFRWRFSTLFERIRRPHTAATPR